MASFSLIRLIRLPHIRIFKNYNEQIFSRRCLVSEGGVVFTTEDQFSRNMKRSLCGIIFLSLRFYICKCCLTMNFLCLVTSFKTTWESACGIVSSILDCDIVVRTPVGVLRLFSDSYSLRNTHTHTHTHTHIQIYIKIYI